MENFTGNGWMILGMTLVIGWLLGLLSRSGGAKWKKAYDTEHSAHVALRKEYDAHLKQHAQVTTIAPVSDARPLKTGAF